MTPAEVKAFSVENKQAIKDKVDKIIERQMKPAMLQRQGRRAAFGDVQDIYTKWYGHSLVIIAKRRGGRVVDQSAEDFETKSGRLTLVGADLFDVSYFRHTGRWWTIHYDCKLKTALKYLQKPSPLWPW
jgi:hypothetical protein